MPERLLLAKLEIGQILAYLSYFDPKFFSYTLPALRVLKNLKASLCSITFIIEYNVLYKEEVTSLIKNKFVKIKEINNNFLAHYPSKLLNNIINTSKQENENDAAFHSQFYYSCALRD